MTKKEESSDLIQTHPEGLDDDVISLLTGIQPRQQVQQLCNQLADAQRIRRRSVGKEGKRRKIHNFPGAPGGGVDLSHSEAHVEKWRRRLAALVAATGRTEADLMEESIQLLAMKVLRQENGGGGPSE